MLFQRARDLCVLALGVFFLTLTVLSIYAFAKVFGGDGLWLARIAVKVLDRQAHQKESTPGLGEQVVDRLLANDARLAVRIIRQVMEQKGGKPAEGSGNVQLLSQTIDRLLANDGELLSKVLVRIVQRKKRSSMQTAFDRLLANDGALLSKILIRLTKSRKRSQPSAQELLLKNPKILSQVLSDVLTHLGAKTLVAELRTKIKAINTSVDVRTEIRNALQQLPSLIVKMKEAQQDKKLLQHKNWREIKAQFPQIEREILAQPCVRLVKLKRDKKDQILARVRIKMLDPQCVKKDCAEYVRAIDQAILKFTRVHGLHEGHIQIKFNPRKRKCNTNR